MTYTYTGHGVGVDCIAGYAARFGTMFTSSTSVEWTPVFGLSAHETTAVMLVGSEAKLEASLYAPPDLFSISSSAEVRSGPNAGASVQMLPQYFGFDFILTGYKAIYRGTGGPGHDDLVMTVIKNNRESSTLHFDVEWVALNNGVLLSPRNAVETFDGLEGFHHRSRACVVVNGAPASAGVLVTLEVTSGPQSGSTLNQPTGDDGCAYFNLASTVPGRDVIVARAPGVPASDPGSVDWIFRSCPANISPTPTPTPNTPPGSNVIVQTGDASVTFPTITQSGRTTFTTISPGAAGTSPSGYTICPTCPAYNITTTASYTPPVTVCLGVPASISPQIFSTLALMHGEGGVLVDRTTGRFTDINGNRTVCGSVSSLSPFALAQAPSAAATVDGRVLTPDGRGLRNATVALVDSNNNMRTATTSSFGFFSFDNVSIGNTYTIRISSKRYRYAPQTVQVNSNLILPDFVGLE